MTLDPERLRRLTDPAGFNDASRSEVWSPAREDAVLRRLQQEERGGDTRSRAPVRWMAYGGAAAAAVVAVFLANSWLATTPERDGVMTSAEPSPVRFRDGTSITPLDQAADVVVATASDALTQVQLREGGARFDVTPDPKRRFRVEAGLVTVDVLGTEFDVVRSGERVEVRVLRGRVSVSWPGGEQLLTRGESGSFPPIVAQREASPVDRVAIPPGDPLDDSGPAAPSLGNEASEPANADPPRGAGPKRKTPRHGLGPQRTDKAPPAETSKEVETDEPGGVEGLMKAADQARRAGKADEAIASLTRVLEDHPRDRRAALAAFTIGRIELSRRHFRSAAQYFAKVRTMGQTSLAEHALAREVEAWSGAGERNKAQQRATEYLLEYPDGPRAAQVRRIAGG